MEITKEGTCCFCGEKYTMFGNSTWGVWKDEYDPRGETERCCDKCNLDIVLPARLKRLNHHDILKIEEVPFSFEYKEYNE